MYLPVHNAAKVTYKYVLCRVGRYNLNFGITLCEAEKNYMLFTDSLQIAEVP